MPARHNWRASFRSSPQKSHLVHLHRKFVEKLTPQEGYQLAIKLSRLAVKTTQPDVVVLKHERPKYAADADSLIAVSHVVATHFQTIAEANDFWRVGQ